MASEEVVQQFAEFEIVLTVGLDDCGQAMLGQDQLAGGGVLAVDGEHALLHQSRQVVPVVQSVMIDRHLQAGAKGGVDVGGQPLKQGRDAGEKVDRKSVV